MSARRQFGSTRKLPSDGWKPGIRPKREAGLSADNVLDQG
jgi:hypothetical protein